MDEKEMMENQVAGSGCEILVPFNERKPLKEIEKSIVKKYRRPIWTNFIKAIKEFELIKEGDKIAVGVSGGKDSILMAKLFQELKRHKEFDFEVEFIAMDPGYYGSIRELLISNCEYLNIPINLFDSNIFHVIDKIAQDYPCYMCAKMRRGTLYAKAKELGCNKLALGHHFNDVIETTLINLFYAGSFQTMLPKLKAANFAEMELIRPMYYIHEEHIEEFIRSSGIWPLNCACMVAAKRTSTKRHEMKELVAKMKENYSEVDKSIFTAAMNVNLDGILGWKSGGRKHSFLEHYDDEIIPEDLNE